MTKVEEAIGKQLQILQDKCGKKHSCGEMCYCRAIAEVLGYHRAVLPAKYADLDIIHFTGKVGNKQVVDSLVVNRATSSFMSYCFDDPSLLSSTPRSKLNQHSVMDKRFSDGTGLVIHGEVKKNEFKKNSPALGRSMLAALVMKEAIWRRLFKSNKALSYRFCSIHEMYSEVFDKDVGDNTYMQDWLVIDDIAADEGKRNQIVLDQVLSKRNGRSLPTILVFQFDAFNADIERSLGQMASKMIGDRNSGMEIRLTL